MWRGNGIRACESSSAVTKFPSLLSHFRPSSWSWCRTRASRSPPDEHTNLGGEDDGAAAGGGGGGGGVAAGARVTGDVERDAEGAADCGRRDEGCGGVCERA